MSFEKKQNKTKYKIVVRQGEIISECRISKVIRVEKILPRFDIIIKLWIEMKFCDWVFLGFFRVFFSLQEMN
jgi:hypothetical protein